MDKPKTPKIGNYVSGPMQGSFALSIRQRVSLSIVGLLSVSYGVILFSTDFVILRDRLQRHERLVMATAEAIQEETNIALGGKTAAKAVLEDSKIKKILDEFSATRVLVWLSRSGKSPLFPTSTSSKDFFVDPGLLKAAGVNAPGMQKPHSFTFGNNTYFTCSLPLRDGQGVLRFLEDVGINPAKRRENVILLVGIWIVLMSISILALESLLRLYFRPIALLETALDAVALDPSGVVEGEHVSINEQPLELQRIAAAFNRLSERLQYAWTRQTLFIRALSHELLTPIALINGSSGRLLRDSGQLDDSQLKWLQSIKEESSRADKLVRDMLDLSRGDSGTLNLSSEPFDPVETVENVIQDVQSLPWGHRTGLIQSSEYQSQQQLSTQNPLVVGDSVRFRQCILNVIENAAKFSPADSPIFLRMAFRDGFFSLQVLDHGPGIPIDERNRVFEPFYRFVSLQSDVSGSGVGLAVVRLLMQHMGGSVCIVEPPQSGTCIELRLKLIAVATKA
jgi:signal transduction histidine kinase